MPFDFPFTSAHVVSVFLAAPEQSNPERFPAGVGWQQAREEGDTGVGAGTMVLEGVGRGGVVTWGVGRGVAFVSSLQCGSSLAAQNFLVHAAISPVF